MAQLVIAAAGNLVGNAILPGLGGQIGWAVGSMIGAGFGPTQRVQGARLSDLKTPAVEYGTPVPVVRGRDRVAGIVIWASDKRELSTTTSSGKGGPSVETTSYSYEQDVLFELSGEPILGVSRVWSNGELIWTALDGASDDSLAASGGAEVWTAIRVYGGGAAQAPDAVYEAAVGVGNAPAYRGRGAVMIEGLQLGTSGQMPLLQFEVLTAATYGLGAAITGPYIESLVNFNRGTVAAQGATAFRIHVGQWDNTYATGAVKVYDIDVLAGTSVEVGSYSSTIAFTGNPGHGHSDVDIMLRPNGTSVVGYSGVTGSATSWTLSASLGSTQLRFSRVGTAIVFGSTLFGTQLLYRHASSGGGVLATSAALPDFVNSLLILGDQVYAAAKNAKRVYRLDLATLTLQETIDSPSFAAPYSDPWPMLFEFNGEPGIICINPATGSGFRVYVRRAAAWVALGTLDSTRVQSSDLCQSIGIVGNLLISGLGATAPTRYQTWHAPITYAPTTIDLADEVQWLCQRAGLAAADVDATALAGTAVTGYRATQVAPIRSLLEMLASAYYFECVESDKVYLRARGGASAATIAWADLGAGEDQARGDPLGIQRGNDDEVPARVALTYANLSADYQPGTEHSDRLTADGADTRAVSLPIVLTPDRARGIAETMALDGRIAATTFAPALTIKAPALEPTDVVTLTDEDGSSYRVRLVRETTGGGVREFDAVLDDADALVAVGVTNTDYTPAIVVRGAADTTLALLDIPILRDADDAPGLYAAAQAGAGRWPGAQVLVSLDGSAFAAEGTVTRSATMGNATTTLAAWTGGNVFDLVNAVTVNVGTGTLASATREDVLNLGANAALLGAEVIQFITATLVSPGVYTLTGLLRGRRGTEHATGGHTSTDRFVLLTGAGLLRITRDAATIGVAAYWRGVTLGRAIDTAASQLVTDTGVALKPFAPAVLRAGRDVEGVISLTWERRSRLSYRWPSTAALPHSDTPEAYDVELYDTGPALLSTQRVTTTAASINGAVVVNTLAIGCGRLVKIGSAFYGVQANVLTSRRLIKHDSAGLFLAQSFVLGDGPGDTVYGGGYLYSLGQLFTSGVPAAYSTTTVYRIDPADLSTSTASVNAGTNGDWQGICFDGADLWTAGYITGSVFKLNGATLAATTYAVGETGAWAVATDGAGAIFITRPDAGEVLSFTAPSTINWRVTAPGRSYALHYRAGLLYVAGPSSVFVLNPATGATVFEHAGQPRGNAAAGIFVDTGSHVSYMLEGSTYTVQLDASTGDIARQVLLPGVAIAGADGATTYTIVTPTGSFVDYESRGYQLTTSFAGYSVKVYAVSGTVGRGYPATLTL